MSYKITESEESTFYYNTSCSRITIIAREEILQKVMFYTHVKMKEKAIVRKSSYPCIMFFTQYMEVAFDKSDDTEKSSYNSIINANAMSWDEFKQTIVRIIQEKHTTKVCYVIPYTFNGPRFYDNITYHKVLLNDDQINYAVSKRKDLVAHTKEDFRTLIKGIIQKAIDKKQDEIDLLQKDIDNLQNFSDTFKVN